MSSGAKAGIAVVVFVICLCGGAVAWYFYRQKRGQSQLEKDGYHIPMFVSSKEEEVQTGITTESEDLM